MAVASWNVGGLSAANALETLQALGGNKALSSVAVFLLYKKSLQKQANFLPSHTHGPSYMANPTGSGGGKGLPSHGHRHAHQHTGYARGGGLGPDPTQQEQVGAAQRACAPPRNHWAHRGAAGTVGGVRRAQMPQSHGGNGRQ